MRLIRKLILTFTVLLLAPVFLNLNADAATLSLNPASSDLSAGQSYDMQIFVDAEGASIVSADVRVNFDPTKVTIVSITPGTIFSVTNAQTINTNYLTISRAIPAQGTAYTGSNGVYATIRFTANQTGSASFTIPFNTGTTSPSILASGSTNLLTTVNNATYNIQEATGTITPTPTTTSLPDTSVFDDLGVFSTIIGIAAIAIGGNEIYQLKKKVKAIYGTQSVTA